LGNSALEGILKIDGFSSVGSEKVFPSRWEHVKYWWLNREEALHDMFDSGYAQCKRDYRIVTNK